MAMLRNTTIGQMSVAHRPRWSVIGRVLLRQSAVFQMLLLPPLIASVLDGEVHLSISLGVCALLVGLAMAIRRHVDAASDIRRLEAVLSVSLVFVLGVLFTTPAYVALGLTPEDAIFEATSALTTTGYSMITTPEGLPQSAHVLRSWGQWCGGLAIAVAGLAFLMDRGPVSKALGFADFGEEAIESSTRKHARSLFWTYSGLTVIGIAGAVTLVPGTSEGVLLALSAVSTGGMTPRGDSLTSYSVAAQTFLVLLGTAGAISLAFPLLLRTCGIVKAAHSSKVPAFLKIVVLGLSSGILLQLLSGTRSPEDIWRGVLTFLSLQSTTGFTIGPVTNAPPVLILLMILMAIGGQTGSTAGGVKIERARIIAGAVSLTLRRLLSPVRAVLYLRLDGAIIEPERIVFAFALVVTYLAVALCLWITFTLHGLPPMASLFDIVSALSTVGAGTGVIGPDLPVDLKLLSVFAMLLGRLEFFGLLILASPRIWKGRK